MSGIAPRRSRRTELGKGDAREQEMLFAAERLLASGEFAAASVADLTKEAGISRPSFYFYFGSKQALLSAVIEEAVGGFAASLATLPVEGCTPAEVVAATVQAATDLWWENSVALVASVELGSALAEVHERNMATVADVGETTLLLLDKSGYDSAVSAADPAELARLVNALILMTERNFYELARRSAPRAEYDALSVLLTTIWQRAFAVS